MGNLVIIKILIKIPQRREKDQAIAEVDSDKATLELPAEMSGIITLKAEEGDAVAVGEVVCLIDTSAEAPANKEDAKSETTKPEEKKVEAPKASSENKTYATGTAAPAAKKILDEKGIATTDVNGTGRDGRITKEDAIKAVPSMGTPTGGVRSTTRKKMSMLRRKVAERLVEAKNTTAMLTTFNEVNMKPIFDLRAEYKEEFKAVSFKGFLFLFTIIFSLLVFKELIKLSFFPTNCLKA